MVYKERSGELYKEEERWRSYEWLEKWKYITSVQSTYIRKGML
jgi:hypothetical protein